MQIVDEKTLKQVLILLAGVFIFNGVIKLKFIATYLEKYPIIFIAIGILLVYLAVRNK